MADPRIQAALEHMQRTKAEHETILAQVAGDPGMTAETRQMLIMHLYQEEGEQLRRLAALLEGEPVQGGPSGQGQPWSQAPAPAAHPAAPPPPVPPAGAAGPRATVGSLRPSAPGDPLQVGSLRPGGP